MTRHEARQCALQALYQIDTSDSDVMEAISYVLEEKTFSDADVEFIQSLVRGVRSQMLILDEQLSSVMERWSTERVGRVELNVLRLALYEMMFDKTIAAASIIDEAVRLAKSFSTDTAGKFVNGVLAKLVVHVRPEGAKAVQDRDTGGSTE